MSKRIEAEQAEVLGVLKREGPLRPAAVTLRVQLGRAATTSTLRSLAAMGKARIKVGPGGIFYEAV